MRGMVMPKKPPSDPLANSLDLLAKKIAEDALIAPSSKDRLDAFKALTTYHLGLTKVRAENQADDDSKGSFDDFRKQVETDRP